MFSDEPGGSSSSSISKYFVADPLASSLTVDCWIPRSGISSVGRRFDNEYPEDDSG